MNKHVARYYLKNRKRILTQATYRVGREDAEDVVQEVFTRLVKYYHNWDKSQGPFDRWVNGIVRNCILVCKKDQRSRGLFISVESIKNKEKIEPSYEDNEPEIRDMANRLGGLIRKKKFPAKDVIYLKYILGYTRKEIAEQLNISPKSVSMHLDRFKKELIR